MITFKIIAVETIGIPLQTAFYKKSCVLCRSTETWNSDLPLIPESGSYPITELIKHADGTKSISRCQTSAPRNCYMIHLVDPISAQTWQLKNPLPDEIPIESAQAQYEDSFLLIGGYIGHIDNKSKDIYYYNPQLDQWEKLPVQMRYPRAKWMKALFVPNSYINCG